MGYNIKHILLGQLVIFIGFLVGYFWIISINYLLLRVPIIGFEFLVVICYYASLLLVSIGAVITVYGAFSGYEIDPFHLFYIGLLLLMGSVGLFTIAGLTQWNPTINPWWPGYGPKPEAVLVTVLAIFHLLATLVLIAIAVPKIFGETRRLAKVQ